MKRGYLIKITNNRITNERRLFIVVINIPYVVYWCNNKNNHMRKNIKILTKEFAQLQALASVEQPKTIKKMLLDEIVEELDHTYFNFNEGTKKALDEMCFLAKERGFAFASPTYYMEKFGISKNAVYPLIKRLVEANLVVKANRSSSKQNGLGCWVLIFTKHPNFEAICSILNIEKKAEVTADVKAEIVEIPCESKVSDEKTEATFSEPSITSFKENNVKQLNVDKTSSENTIVKKFAKYVPKKINEMYANLFGNDLTEIWRKITLAIKGIGFEFDKETKLEFGMQVIKALFKRVKRGVMTLDEMCAYVYTTTRTMVYNAIGEDFVEDMVEEYGCYFYSSVESSSGLCPTQYEFSVSKEMKPAIDWLIA